MNTPVAGGYSQNLDCLRSDGARVCGCAGVRARSRGETRVSDLPPTPRAARAAASDFRRSSGSDKTWRTVQITSQAESLVDYFKEPPGELLLLNSKIKQIKISLFTTLLML